MLPERVRRSRKIEIGTPGKLGGCMYKEQHVQLWSPAAAVLVHRLSVVASKQVNAHGPYEALLVTRRVTAKMREVVLNDRQRAYLLAIFGID
jgi:hypothetical protein